MKTVTLTEADFNSLYADQALLIVKDMMEANPGDPNAFAAFVARAKEHNAIWQRATFNEVAPTTPSDAKPDSGEDNRYGGNDS